MKVNNILQAVSRNKSNLEAEGGEEVLTYLHGIDIPEKYYIKGKSHKKGGVPLNLPDGSFIFSDDEKLKIDDKDLLEYFGEKKPKTPAELVRKYNVNKYKAVLLNKNASQLDKKTAAVMLNNYLKKMAEIALVQESKKGFPNGIPLFVKRYAKESGVLDDMMDMLQEGAADSGQAEQPKAQFGLEVDTSQPARSPVIADADLGTQFVPSSTAPGAGDLFYGQKGVEGAASTPGSDFETNKYKEFINYISQYPELAAYVPALSSRDRAEREQAAREVNALIDSKYPHIKNTLRSYNVTIGVGGNPISTDIAADAARALNQRQINKQLLMRTGSDDVYTSTNLADRGDYVRAGTQYGQFRPTDKGLNKDILTGYYQEGGETAEGGEGRTKSEDIEKAQKVAERFIEKAVKDEYKDVAKKELLPKLKNMLAYTIDQYGNTFSKDIKSEGTSAYDVALAQLYLNFPEVVQMAAKKYLDPGTIPEGFLKEDVIGNKADPRVDRLNKTAEDIISGMFSQVQSDDNLKQIYGDEALPLLKEYEGAVKKARERSRALGNKQRDPEELVKDSAIAEFQKAILDSSRQEGDNVAFSGIEDESSGKFRFSGVDAIPGSHTLSQALFYVPKVKEGTVAYEPKPIKPPVEEGKKEPKPLEAKKEEDKGDKELKPKNPPKWWQQDVVNYAKAAGDLASLKKYMPWSPSAKTVVGRPVYLDPERALAKLTEMTSSTQRFQASGLPSSTAAAAAAGVASEAFGRAADVIGDVQNRNVGIANQAQRAADIAAQQTLNQEIARRRDLYDKNVIANQQYDNARREALRNLVAAYNQGLTNAALTYNINEYLYKDSPYYIEPQTGGVIRTDSSRIPELEPQKPKDSMEEYLKQYGKFKEQTKDLSEKERTELFKTFLEKQGAAGTVDKSKAKELAEMIGAGYTIPAGNYREGGETVSMIDRLRKLIKK